MLTLIGPDDSQTQWLPVPFVAIALSTNSLFGHHRGSNNIALLVSICKKMAEEKFSWAFKCWICIPGFSVEQRRAHSTRGGTPGPF